MRRLVTPVTARHAAHLLRCVAVPLALAAVLCGILSASDSPGTRLIVLRDGQASERDPTSFATVRQVALPKEAAEHRDRLAANAAGQLLFAPPGDAPVWLWDGRSTRFVDGGARRIVSRASRGRRLSLEAVPRCVLSADGQSLYWFENEFRTTGEPAADSVMAHVSTTFRAWRTDLAGSSRSPIASVALDTCRCGTGVCNETCPEVSVWVPDDGVGTFFIATRWIPGQIGTTYVASWLYRRAPGRWTARPLPQAFETVLDASPAGDAIVHAVNDAGCCGWMNESDDRTLLLRGRKTLRLFDEREEYRNDNYDVSFYTPAAKISPDGRFVAMTLASTLQPGEDIRLSIDGKRDPAELERVRQAASELPAVAVVDIAGAAPVRSLRIPRASLVGWVDERHVLVRTREAYELADVRGGRPISVPLPADAEVLVRSR